MHKLKITNRESGMVSIIVTMFLMVIISLLVIGFAKVMRREQRQVLDRQLSTQAFYAAESGVNDAIAVLKTNPSAAKSSCGPDATFTNDGILDSSHGVAYTCLIVNPSLTQLKYDTIDTEKSTIIPINASGAIRSLNISWESKTANTNFGSCPSATSLPAFTAWPSVGCDAGVIRVDIAPTGGSLTRAGLMSGTLTAFLYPQNSGTNTLAYNAQGPVVGVTCTSGASPKACNLSVTGLGGTNYYMRVRSIYKQNSLAVSATGAGNSVLSLIGAQAQIDSTGKATDVLRRVSVRVDAANISGFPDFAIQTRDSMCKRFYAATNIAPFVESNDAACSLN